jgi:hypothetical protein
MWEGVCRDTCVHIVLDITATKEMYSVSVSDTKVLTFSCSGLTLEVCV